MGGRTHGGRDQSWEQERRRQHVWIHVASHLSSAVYGVTAKDERKEGRKGRKEMRSYFAKSSVAKMVSCVVDNGLF